MKRITLPLMFTAAIAMPLVAQIPPTPPARPVPATEPTPRPAPAPRAIPARPMDWDFRFDYDYHLDQMEVERMARDAARAAVDAQRLDIGRIRDQALEASREVQRMNLDIARINADAYRDMNHEWTPMAPMAPMPAMPRVEIPPMAPMALTFGQEHFRMPPAPWAQGDPADSLYRVARNALTNGDYGRAAKLFADLTKNYPKSAYADDSPYWEATARYKIGTTDELHTAVKLLEPLVAKIPDGTTPREGRGASFCYNGRCRTSDNDVAALSARIYGVLAQRGDRDAQGRLETLRKKFGGTLCDQEYAAVQSEALSTLTQMDWKTAQPTLKTVLDRRDECSVQLRRNAVYMIGRRTDAESGTMLISVAKSDPNTDVRTSAIEMLARIPGDAGYTALEDILRSDQDERIQKAAVRALTQSDNQRARTSMRALIDRKDAPLSLRIEAINSFNSERATADDAAYLRGLYPRAESDNLKRAIVDAVGRIGGKENDSWIISLAGNSNEPSSIRATAMSRLSRSNISIAEIGKLYDGADSYNMRTQLINVLRSRKEPEAADKLVDIFKNTTDYKIKMQALNAISQRNDARSQQLLTEIFKNP